MALYKECWRTATDIESEVKESAEKRAQLCQKRREWMCVLTTFSVMSNPLLEVSQEGVRQQGYLLSD